LTLHYRGHGAGAARSSGDVRAVLSLQEWIDDVLSVLDRAPNATFVLVGSSLGAWLALHAALARPHAVRAFLLVAPAPDASRRWAALGDDTAAGPELVTVPSAYVPGGGIALSRALLADANARHRVLGGANAAALRALRCPAHILHGGDDDVVPVGDAAALARGLPGSTLEVVRGGDHRLSREEDLDRMERALRGLVPLG
jgi:pimeloyl-ACP methyl ester carboxylesterase